MAKDWNTILNGPQIAQYLSHNDEAINMASMEFPPLDTLFKWRGVIRDEQNKK